MLKRAKVAFLGLVLAGNLSGMEEKPVIIENYEPPKQQQPGNTQQVKSLVDCCLNKVTQCLDSDRATDTLLSKLNTVALPEELTQKVRTELLESCFKTIWPDYRKNQYARSFDDVTESSKNIRCVALNDCGFAVVGFCNNSEINNKAALISVVRQNSTIVLEGHEGEITSVAFSAGKPHKSRAATGSTDKTVRIWDCFGEGISILKGHEDAVNSVALSASGNYAITGSKDKTVGIWNTDTGKCLLRLSGHGDEITSVALSQNGSVIASASKDKTVRLWDVATGNCLNVLSGHTEAINCVAISRFGDFVVSGSLDNTVRFWDTASGSCIFVGKHPHAHFYSHGIYGVSISNDENFFVSCSDNGQAIIWNTKTKEELSKLHFGGVLNGITIDHTNRFVLANSRMQGPGLGTNHTVKVLVEELYSKMDLPDLIHSIRVLRNPKKKFLLGKQKDGSFAKLQKVLPKRGVPVFSKLWDALYRQYENLKD